MLMMMVMVGGSNWGFKLGDWISACVHAEIHVNFHKMGYMGDMGCMGCMEYMGGKERNDAGDDDDDGWGFQ